MRLRINQKLVSRNKVVTIMVVIAFSALFLASCKLLDQLSGDDSIGGNDDALKRCVVTGHALGGGACVADSVAADWTKSQCEAQDDTWKDQRDALEDESTMTCEADWD